MSIDSNVFLAMVSKAVRVFESESTFLSMPTSPVTFTKKELACLSGGEIAGSEKSPAEDLKNLSEWSRQVNLIPTGRIWPPDEEAYLWDIYEEILTQADLASSTRTQEQEEEYDKAWKVLFSVTEKGDIEDSDAFKKYKQFKDAWHLAKQDYYAKKTEAVCSTDDEIITNWNEVTEPSITRMIKTIENEWETKGHRTKVENAKRTLSALEAVSPSRTWQQWDDEFNPDLDARTDTNGNLFFLSGFSPIDAIESDDWQEFNLTEDEMKKLLVVAPEEIRKRLLTNPSVKGDVESLAFDYSSVLVTRPWFEPGVFKSRFWRFYDKEKIVCDGKKQPSGECPSYISALVFAKNLRIKRKQKPTDKKKLRTVRFIPVRSFGIFKTAQIKKKPVPRKKAKIKPWLRILSAPGQKGFKGTPQKPTRKKLALRIQKGATLKKFSNLKGIKSAKEAGLKPFDARRMRRASFTRALLRKKLAKVLMETKAKAKQKPKESKTAYEDEIFVLAYICKRVPKCPNPDPNYNW